MESVGLPTNKRELRKAAQDLIEACRSSAGTRAAYYRQIDRAIETGRSDGSRALINKLFNHIDRLASHLYSPTDLRFMLDFEYSYPQEILNRAGVVSRVLTRDFERSNTDMTFGQGVFESLKFGASILKQWPQEEGQDRSPVMQSALVMPWQFGVYREDLNDLGKQPAMCETMMLSLPELWRRIWHMPDAEKLFERARSHASQGQGSDDYNSFFHQVMSTAPLNTSVTGLVRPNVPGGIVQLNTDPNYGILGPQIAVDTVKMHELWVMDGDDYTTVQLIEPDILVAPRYAKRNLLVSIDPASGAEPSGLHPYTLIQPNHQHGYFWGFSEATQLIPPQELLATWLEDVKRLMGVQFDKLLAFIGDDGLTDERYGEMRNAGYMNLQPGSSVSDLTPKFPQEALPLIDMLMKSIDMLGGFDNIMQGRGEQGVRAGSHAEMLTKMASPRLRDRSLLVERQCATAADLRLHIMQAKCPQNYWTDGSSMEKMKETQFNLTDLPDDWRVAVDSHTGSPIFADDHQQLIAFGLKNKIVDGHYAIEHLPFPDKDLAQQRLKQREAALAALTKQLAEKDPEGFEKALTKQGGHHK